MSSQELSRSTLRLNALVTITGSLLRDMEQEWTTKSHFLFFLQVEHLEGILLDEINAELYKVTYKQLQFFSDVATSTGLLGE